MSDHYGKGSIVYKILIVLLTAALIGSIYYPKKLWDEEARNTQICRYNLENLHNAELQYLRFHGSYTDSLDELIEFVKTDSAYHAYVDSIFAVPIARFVAIFDSLNQEQSELDQFIPQISPDDSVMLDSLQRRIESITGEVRILRDRLESLREFLKTHPCAPLSTFDGALEVVERKDFFLQYRIIENDVRQGKPDLAMEASQNVHNNYQKIIGSLKSTIENLDQIYTLVESLRYCPTVRKPYVLAVIDTSVIKYADVYCPIDSLDIARVENDFMLSTIGALKIENHGKIQGGEKSWETGPKR